MPNPADNFSQRIILVHPLQANSIIYATDETLVFDQQNELDLMQTLINAYIKKDIMLTDEAVIGSHLHFTQMQYTNSFVDRPHIHWWWNGLFHANSGGNWEDAFFAWLEPMDRFSHVIGCAPYDTMTVGPHQLSEASCILVPQICVSALRERLKQYHGKIIGYDHLTTTLRQAINASIKEHYPETLHLLNKNGKDINEPQLCNNNGQFDNKKCSEYDYEHNAGYFRSLYIRDKEGPILPLMKGLDSIELPAFKEYQKGRFIGLHQGAPTDVERNKTITVLKLVTNKPESIAKYADNFIAKGSDPQKLCILETYKVYKKLTVFAQNTGAHDYADYLVKKALIADLRSLCPTAPIEPKALSNLIEPNYEMLLMNVQQVADNPIAKLIQNYRGNLLILLQKGKVLEDVNPHIKKTNHSGNYYDLTEKAKKINKRTPAAYTFVHNCLMDYSKAYVGSETLASLTRFFTEYWGSNEYGGIITKLLLNPRYRQFNESNLIEFYADLNQQININAIKKEDDLYTILTLAKELTERPFSPIPGSATDVNDNVFSDSSSYK